METISISTLQKTQKQLWKTYTQLLKMYDPQVNSKAFWNLSYLQTHCSLLEVFHFFKDTF